MAMEFMSFRLITQDTDAKGGIREGFFHDADELYDIFGHKGQTKGNALI